MRMKELHTERTAEDVYRILDAWNQRGVTCCERKGNLFRLSIGTRKPFQRSAFSFRIQGTVEPAEDGTWIRYSIQPAPQTVLLLAIPLLVLLSGLLHMFGGNGSPVFVLIALVVNVLIWLCMWGEMREFEQIFTGRIGDKNLAVASFGDVSAEPK